MRKKKFVIVGAGNRGLNSYVIPMVERYSDYAELVGVYDINHGRSEVVAKYSGARVYDNFDTMLDEERPDSVIITTVDAYHSDYIIKSMEKGYDVISEKPMTIDAAKCQEILDAEKRTGKKLTVTFNYRYVPYSTKIKQLIRDGIIGKVYSIHFEWSLDRSLVLSGHGSSYYRRWNSIMKNSGGLLVHKSTHHFDLINWVINDEPEYVAAFGKLNVYGKDNAPFSDCGTHCRVCKCCNKCEFYYELNEQEKELYADNEKLDNYYKDACVFREEIDIYDTMSVNVQYKKGALLSYSLNSTAAYEGWKMIINGEKGRLEAQLIETGIYSGNKSNEIRVYDLNNNVTQFIVPVDNGSHGGGDERLLRQLFIGNQDDPYGHFAGSKAGANSLLIGACANKSIKTGKIIAIDDEIRF